MFEENKRFSGAPFGVQTARFDVSGMHPKSKKPGAFTEIPYDSKWTEEKMRLRGPGMYQPDLQGFHPLAVEMRAEGPGWAREQEIETEAAMPHLLHRELFEQRRELKRRVGPGSYDFRDFIQNLASKPKSVLGICEPRSGRFGRITYSITPGPGTYGKNGVPHTLLEEKNRQSTSTKGMLECDSGNQYHLLSIYARNQYHLLSIYARNQYHLLSIYARNQYHLLSIYARNQYHLLSIYARNQYHLLSIYARNQYHLLSIYARNQYHLLSIYARNQ
ncbi:hypothetical protein ACOMHN_006310 [Nucella lapillus]